MGKTGTTNEFKDAVVVGSTYGPDGITAAVRIRKAIHFGGRVRPSVTHSR